MAQSTKLSNTQLVSYVKELIAGNESHVSELYQEMRHMCHLQCKYGEYYFDQYLTEEDFFQDTIYSFLKYKHLYDEEKGAFVTWYNTLIQNLYISKYKKRKRQPDMVPLEIQIGDDEMMSYEKDLVLSNSAEKHYFEFYNHNQIMEKINELKPEYRDAIIFTKIQDMSAREAASKMGISEYTFNVRNYRAKKLLEQKLMELEMEI